MIGALHDGPSLPARLAPLVLLGSVWTHLFGGSAGREGTAVQMGACIADQCSARLGLAGAPRRRLLVAGVAGGFGSVFGTPLAGAVFGIEVAVLGRPDHRAATAALVAALVGDLTTRALDVTHTAFTAPAARSMSWELALRWALFAGAVALTTAAFVELTDRIKAASEAHLTLPWRMAAGGAAVAGLATLTGTTHLLGLSIPTLTQAFVDPGLPAWTFAAKALLTALTIGAGFIGGEVTPLFVIGATLGNALAPVLGLPLDLAAGVGMAATFAAAANTPLALTVMAVELLGPNALPHTLLVCLLAFVLSGHRGIYPAQRVALSKRLRRHEPPVQLAEVGRGSVPGHPRHDGPTGAPG